MQVLADIEHLDGIAIQDSDDRAEEGVGMGWRGDREGQDKEGREQTQERKGHDVPRTADMGTLEGSPVRRPRAAEMTRVVSNIISSRISKIRSSDFCRSIRTAAPLAERRRKGPFSTRTGHRAELADRSLCPMTGLSRSLGLETQSGCCRPEAAAGT
ncbi:hypothetical protein THIOKS13150002 [Thiocapsa sp. KS1]|nr:hypothetical protein THIOKS13150002 [Thiocapsa sp. KS1]